MRMECTGTAVTLLLLVVLPASAAKRPASQPATQPGDAMIDAYLAGLAQATETVFPGNIKTAHDWLARRPELLKEYRFMLGLDPLPERTALNATVTGSIKRDGYVVDLLHYQSRPGLYVTANLYRPVEVKPGERLPAVLYLCGHSGNGRAGVKVSYQSFPIWFARHGYICLIIDTLERGEIKGIHHGTYRYGRFWWISRGYTPAGVECWNGVRALDYLTSRPDVNPRRIAVTGISGGGASTIYLAAMDERVSVAVPVSGMSDLIFYVAGHGVDGHCDCMFMHNAYAWPWVQVAALIAPRPVLFANSDFDHIFPMEGNERIANRLERFYSLFAAGDRFQPVVSVGGHEYRQDLRQAVYRFINTYLKNDPRPVADSEMDLVVEAKDGKEGTSYPIPPDQLRVFPRDEDLPKDQLNTTIDEHFVPVARLEVPGAGGFDAWKQSLVKRLRETSFRNLPGQVPAVGLARTSGPLFPLRSEEGITIEVLQLSDSQDAKRCLIALTGPEGLAEKFGWLDTVRQAEDRVFVCTTRGCGQMQWDTSSPPNRVARSHVLLGRTVDAGRVWDAMAAVRLARRESGPDTPIYLAGSGSAGVVAAYAALLEPEIAGVTLIDPPMSHMDPKAPVLLNVLRVCDIPDVLGALAPRPLMLVGAKGAGLEKVRKIYEAAGAGDRLTVR